MIEDTCETCKYFYQYKTKSVVDGQCQYLEVKRRVKVPVKINDSCEYHSSHSPSIVNDVKRNHEILVCEWKLANRNKRLSILERNDDCSDEAFQEMDRLEKEIKDIEEKIESLNKQQ